MVKEQGKLVESTAAYENDEDALSWEFGSDTKLNELKVAGSLPDTVEHRRRGWLREHGVNAVVLASAAQFQRPVDLESQIEETHPEDGESGFITTQ